MEYPILFPKNTRFLFLAGTMKSGTTWLMNLLNFHPDIVSQGEMHAIEHIDGVPPPPTLESVALHSDRLHSWYHMPNNAWNEPFRSADQKYAIAREMEKDYVRFFYEWSLKKFIEANQLNIPRILCDKSPAHTDLFIEKLEYFFSDYQPLVLHLIRDPRDMAVSSWFHLRRTQAAAAFEFAPPFKNDTDKLQCEQFLKDPDSFMHRNTSIFHYPKFLEDVFKEWIKVNISINKACDVMKSRYLCIKYEDLKEKLPVSLFKVFQWLGIDDTEEAVAKVLASNSLAKKPAVFRKGTTGEWKHYFTDVETQYFVETVEPYSKKFGYSMKDGSSLKIVNNN